jgi:hypothetical protein
MPAWVSARHENDNPASNMTEPELTDLFAKYFSGRSKGFAFVETGRAVLKAIIRPWKS